MSMHLMTLAQNTGSINKQLKKEINISTIIVGFEFSCLSNTQK